MAALVSLPMQVISPPKYGKVSVADEVVRTMGIPENILERARAILLQELGADCDNAIQLYQKSEELMNNPEKLGEMGKKMPEAEQAVEEKMTYKEMRVKEVEEKAMLKGKAALGEAAEMQEKAEAQVKAKPIDDKTQLKEKVHKLAVENHRLRQRKLCRKCKEVDLATSGVTFLPCGHFITCEVCSETYEDCPACGKNIMGTVRTFLS